MDDYDYVEHTDTFDRTLNIYSNDDIEDQIRAFLSESPSKERNPTSVIKEMCQCITTMRNALSIMDGRYITCVGSRFCHYHTLKEAPLWYLIRVWRKVRD